MKKRRSMSKIARRGDNSSGGVDINSLLDILMILLIFLIKSFGSNEMEITIPKEISIPLSKSTNYVKKNLTVQIMEDGDLLLGEEFVTNIVKNSSDLIIEPLYKLLISKKESFEKIRQEVNALGDNKDKKIPNLNLVMDGMVKYDLLRKVMSTASQAGFKEFKFIVKHLGE